ncbi:MAG: right-handed parallel beta-helix repeat-containing protein [Clostridia bacterium]|nr:right-handed parallel beta-helix repeat-containing protein [Clostridia bacterium]
MYTIQNSSTLYVSQSQGNDALYNGLSPTPDQYGNGPFKTLERALRIIRDLRTCDEKKPLTLALVDDYFLENPIRLSSPISDLTIESFGERKKIVGGISLGGWKRDRFHGVDCISAELPKKQSGEPWEFTDLFVNGCRADATRYPKQGILRVRSTGSVPAADVTHLDHWSFSTDQFQVDPRDLAAVENIQHATVNYYHYWIDEHSPVASYDQDSGTLRMRYTSRFSASGLYEKNHPSSVFYYLTNVPNTFETKNEWYLDRKKGIVYYIPEDMSIDPGCVTAFIPTLDHLLDISAEDIRIRNLELTCTASDYASKYVRDPITNTFVEGDAFYGSDIQSVCWAPGAIRIKNSKRCAITNCYVHGVGVHAIEIKTGCTHIRIENNCICDVSAGGIKIFGGAYGENEELLTCNCLIRENHISHCGKRYEAGCGVFIAHAANNEISDNEIHDTGYTGISVGWVWGYANSSTYGNVIRGNHLYRIGRGELSDLGGIYLLGKQHGTYVSENRIHDVKSKIYGGWGIYLDEGSSYVTVESNVVYHTQDEAFHIHYGSHNTVRNNIFYTVGRPCLRTSKNDLYGEIVCEQNVFITQGAPIYHETTGVHTEGFRRNLLWDTSRQNPVLFVNRLNQGFDLEAFQRSFHQECGSIVADPMIKDIDRFDFTLSKSSPAFSMGFTNIPEKVTRGTPLDIEKTPM